MHLALGKYQIRRTGVVGRPMLSGLGIKIGCPCLYWPDYRDLCSPKGRRTRARPKTEKRGLGYERRSGRVEQLRT